MSPSRSGWLGGGIGSGLGFGDGGSVQGGGGGGEGMADVVDNGGNCGLQTKRPESQTSQHARGA